MSTRCWTVEDEGITDRHVAFPPNENLEKSRSIQFDGMSEQNQTLSEAGGFHYWVGMRWYATSNGILIYVGVPYPVATLFLCILDAGVCNHVTLTSIFFPPKSCGCNSFGCPKQKLTFLLDRSWHGNLFVLHSFFKVFRNCFRFFFPFSDGVFSKYRTFSLFRLSGEVLKLHIRLNLHHKPGCSNKGTFWMYRMRRWLSKILGTSFIPIPFKHFPFHGSLYRGGHAFGRGENEKSRLRRKVFLLVVCDYSMDPWAICDLLDGNCVTIPDIWYIYFFLFFLSSHLWRPPGTVQ